MIPINHFSWSDSLPCHSASAHCHYTAIGLIALKRETQKYCLWLLKKRLVNSYFQIRFSFSFGRWLLTISSLLWWLLWRPPFHHHHGGGSRAFCSQRHNRNMLPGGAPSTDCSMPFSDVNIIAMHISCDAWLHFLTIWQFELAQLLCNAPSSMCPLPLTLSLIMIKLFQIKSKSNCHTWRQTRRNNQATDDDPSLPKTYCLHYWTRQDNHCCQPRILAKLCKIIVVQSGYDQYIAKQWENIVVHSNHCCPHRLFAKPFHLEFIVPEDQY